MGFSPCYSFKPKFIIREQILFFVLVGRLFVCSNYRNIFEGSSDLIHSTGFYYFSVNGLCEINYGFLPVEIKGPGGVSDIVSSKITSLSIILQSTFMVL